MVLKESQIQCNYIQWLQWHFPKVFKVTCSFANSGARTLSYGARMKREGLKAGFPDVGVFYPSRGYHGLFIEFKSKNGKLTALQKESLGNLNEQGYKGVVCYSLEDAIAETKGYLSTQSQSACAQPSELP